MTTVTVITRRRRPTRTERIIIADLEAQGYELDVITVRQARAKVETTAGASGLVLPTSTRIDRALNELRHRRNVRRAHRAQARARRAPRPLDQQAEETWEGWR